MFDNYYDFLWVEDNNLQFGSLELMMDNGIWEFLYDPQQKIGNDTIVEVVNNTTFSYTIDVTGEDNIYKWYKDGSLLADQTSNTLYIENASYDDQGIYVLKVTNTSVSTLELVSYDAELSIITGMEEVVDVKFEMYPNPASGSTLNVIVNDPAQVENFMIINGSGQIVKAEKLTTRNSTVDISNLNTGIYIVKIAYKNSSYQMEKLIVK